VERIQLLVDKGVFAESIPRDVSKHLVLKERVGRTFAAQYQREVLKRDHPTVAENRKNYSCFYVQRRGLQAIGLGLARDPSSHGIKSRGQTRLPEDGTPDGKKGPR